MTYKRILSTGIAATIGLAASFMLLTILAGDQLPENEPIFAAGLDIDARPALSPVVEPPLTVTFPSGPWPWYA